MDDEGAASVMVFIVAGVLFLGVVALLLTTVVNKIPPSTAAAQVDAGHGLEARALMNRFVVASGYGYDAGAEKWADGPSFPAPGLGDGQGGVDRDKLEDLLDGLNAKGDAPLAGTGTDGQLDYYEARDRLDLDNKGLKGFQFYLAVTASDDTGACVSLAKAFGPPPPVDVALEAATRTFQLAGDCGGSNPASEHTTVDVSLVVFQAALP